MSDQLLPILLQNALTEQRSVAGEQRQLLNNAMLQALAGFANLVETAETPQQLKQAYSALNRQWKTMTKEIPDAPDQLISELDVQSAVSMAEKNFQIRMPLISGTSNIIADLMGGRTSMVDAQASFTKLQTQLTNEFGAEAGPGVIEQQDRLFKFFEIKSRQNLASLQATAGLVPYLGQAISRAQVDFREVMGLLGNLDGAAQAEVAQIWGIDTTGDGLSGIPPGIAMAQRGADFHGLDPNKIVSLPDNDPDKIKSIQTGWTLYRRDVEKMRSVKERQLFNQAAGALDVSQASASDIFDGIIQLSNRFFGTDGTITAEGLGFFRQNPFRETLEQIQGAQENTQNDVINLQDAVVQLAKRGFLDDPKSGFIVSDLGANQILSMADSGALNDAMDSVTGEVDGKELSLMDILVDPETQLVRGYAWKLLPAMDVEKVKAGDADAWHFLASSMDAGPDWSDTYKSPSGKSAGETLFSVLSTEEGFDESGEIVAPPASALTKIFQTFLVSAAQTIPGAGVISGTVGISEPAIDALQDSGISRETRKRLPNLGRAIDELNARTDGKVFEFSFDNPLLQSQGIVAVLDKQFRAVAEVAAETGDSIDQEILAKNIGLRAAQRLRGQPEGSSPLGSTVQAGLRAGRQALIEEPSKGLRRGLVSTGLLAGSSLVPPITGSGPQAIPGVTPPPEPIEPALRPGPSPIPLVRSPLSGGGRASRQP